SLRRHQVLDQPVEVGANLCHRGTRMLERAQLLGHDERRVTVERAEKQLALPSAESVIEASRLHTRRGDEIIDRRVVVAPAPELVHRTLQHLIGIELSRARHDGEPSRTIVQKPLQVCEDERARRSTTAAAALLNTTKTRKSS